MIDDVINSLQDKFLLEREEDVAEFLGIQMERNSNTDKITLTQTELIVRILKAMSLDDSNPKYTPADKKLILSLVT